MASKAQAGPAFPILGILGLIFITLKLTGHISWSWLWVLAPFWIPAIFIVMLAVLAGFIAISTVSSYKRF